MSNITRVLTVDELRTLDSSSGVDIRVLIERAGASVADAAFYMRAPARSSRDDRR